ncbi:MAG TPA: hypothetical protein VIX35_11235 [Vicinamibacterales bacterium]
MDGTWALEALGSSGPPSAPATRNTMPGGTGPIPRVNLTLDATTTQADRTYDSMALTHLFIGMHYLSIGVTSSVVTVLDDSGRNAYDVSKRGEAHNVAGLPVKVTPEWRDSSLVLEIAGEHGLKAEQVVQPSPDGSRLTVTWTLQSPKAQPPLTTTRSYRRLSATPPAADRPIAGDTSTQVTQDASGQQTVIQSLVLTLFRDHPTQVLLATRPASAIRLTLLSVNFGTAGTIDFTAPNATLQIITGPGVRQAQPPNVDLPIGDLLTPARGPVATHVRGVTMVLTGGTTSEAKACFLPAGFAADSSFDAGEVTFSAGRGFSPDGTTNCESAVNGFRLRLAYARAIPAK